MLETRVFYVENVNMAMAADGDGGSGDVDHLGGIGAPALEEEPAMELEDLEGVGQVEGRRVVYAGCAPRR